MNINAVILLIGVTCSFKLTNGQQRVGPYDCVKINFIHKCSETTADDDAKFRIQVRKNKMGRSVKGGFSFNLHFDNASKMKIIAMQRSQGGEWKPFYDTDVKEPITIMKDKCPKVHAMLKSWYGWTDESYLQGNYSVSFPQCTFWESMPVLPYGRFMVKVMFLDKDDKYLGCLKPEVTINPKVTDPLNLDHDNDDSTPEPSSSSEDSGEKGEKKCNNGNGKGKGKGNCKDDRK